MNYYEFKNRSWQADVASFQRYKELINHITIPSFRTQVIEQLNKIKARWPRELKNEIIPTV
jgi:hypothetical protein